MKRWLPLLILAAACAAPDVTELYVAERDFFRVDRQLRNLRDEGRPYDRLALRSLAADFETVALTIPEGSAPVLRAIEGQAWLRAAECHFDLVDSGRAELILARLAADFRDLPNTFAEVSYKLGRVTELHGQYRATITHYRDVFERIEPDPGPDPRKPPDPEARPEERTADDFVLRLPLYAARLAVRDTTVADPGRYYDFARDYYSGMLEDPSPFLRVESAVLLAEVLADQGRWTEASQTLDAIEGRIPGIVMTRFEPSDVRLASFVNQVQALRYGMTSADSVRALLEDLIEDYLHGDAAPTALFSMAECTHDLGENQEAHRDIARLVRDYPTAPVVPEAQLLRARMYADERRLRDARRTIRALPLEFPTSGAALRAPLEIIAFYQDAEDAAGERDAMGRAETRYREILERYPGGPHSFTTRSNLVIVLDMQGRFAESVDELIAMCDEIATPTQRPGLLSAAARRAETLLEDRERAARLYERLAEEFPNTRLGRAAVRGARRLRTTSQD